MNATKPLLERLREQADYVRSIDGPMRSIWDDAVEEIEALRAALMPFAKMAASYVSFDGQHDYADDFIAYGEHSGEHLSDLDDRKQRSNEITVRDLRHAAVACHEPH
jgi:hypothetical protein